MNVLLITPNLNIQGGVSTYWKSLLCILDTYEELKISKLEVGGHGKNIFGPFWDQWSLYKQLKEQYDLVIINPSLAAKSFFRDGLFARQLTMRKVHFFVFFHGWQLSFEKKVDLKYKNFFLYSLGQAKKIFVLSNGFKKKILEWGYKGEIVLETTNIDSSLLRNFSLIEKVQTIKTTKKIKILFLARLLKEKGVFETIEAFNILVQVHDNIELIIAGDGKDYEALKLRVEGNEKIIVVGHIEGQEKIKLFTQSHIYCLASYSEGLPTSVLEAMAFGLPIITTRVGGLKDFFQDKKMGYFVKTKDSRQIVEKLELLLTDRDSICKMGEFNHKYAKKELLNTVVAERIYKQIKSEVKKIGSIDE